MAARPAPRHAGVRQTWAASIVRVGGGRSTQAHALTERALGAGLSYSRTRALVDYDRKTVISKSVEFVVPTAAGFADPVVDAVLAPYRPMLAAAFDVTLGSVATAVFPRANSIERSTESALGNLIADCLRNSYGTDIALLNGGGIRDTLPGGKYLPTNKNLRRPPAGYLPGPPFDLVVGDVRSVLPFQNVFVTRTVTGALVWKALNNGVSQVNAATNLGADGRYPQVRLLRCRLRPRPRTRP